MKRALRNAVPFLVLLVLAAPAAQAATVTIVNMDNAGEGFNDDSMPVVAMACPAGMTLGQCRLHAAQMAAQVWADLLVSNVEVRVYAYFDPLSCGLLGQSEQLSPAANFPGAPLANTWYQRPLADALSGTDRNPGLADLRLTYNSNYDNGVCTGGPWYYGTDANPGLTGALLFYPVILHEMTHGLGFASFVDKYTGAWYGGVPDVYATLIYDATVGLRWTQMTNGQRYTSIRNNLGVVTDGPETKAAADNFLTGNNMNLVVNAGSAAGTYLALGANYGGSWTAADGLTIPMEVVNDGVGTTSDACEPLIGFTAGNIAFIDRGICEFGQKSLYAEQAGAAGVVIANNQGGTALFGQFPGQWGRQVTIPVIGINQNDGNTIRPTLPVSGTFGVLDVHGLHANGFPLLYTPTTMQPGSSVSHFDVSAEPSALMEPAINDDLWNYLDMTPGLFLDEGWVLGFLFGDGFESGDFSAWSASVP